jgi:hypothetical protein
MKKLIVNADDFGRADGINRGIIDAHTKGIVTSTTVMVNYPTAAAGIEQALADAPDLGLGLHVTLTSGAPVSALAHVPSLVGDDGRFHHISVWAEHYDDFAAGDLQREIAAQVERFITLAGRPPDHLDSHHHAAYLHPAGLEALLEIARGYNIPLRNGMLDRPTAAVTRWMDGLIPGLTVQQATRIVEQVKAKLAELPDPPFWPAHFEMSWYDKTATLADLLVILTNLPDDAITELMCHPGYIDPDFNSVYAAQREAEIAHLTHPATRECVQFEFIDLITFADIPRPTQR